jgi:hypothetical protein
MNAENSSKCKAVVSCLWSRSRKVVDQEEWQQIRISLLGVPTDLEEIAAYQWGFDTNPFPLKAEEKEALQACGIDKIVVTPSTTPPTAYDPSQHTVPTSATTTAPTAGAPSRTAPRCFNDRREEVPCR